MVCILKISAWILFKKLRFVRILKDFSWQCEKLYSHAWVCQICGITILSRFHTRCQSRHWSVTRFLKLSHNNKAMKFSQLLYGPPMYPLYMSRQRFIHFIFKSITCCTSAGQASRCILGEDGCPLCRHIRICSTPSWYRPTPGKRK